MPERIVAEVRTAAPSIERRKSGRVALNRLGVIGVGHGHPIGESVVGDLSAGGARITIAPRFGVPDEFVLLVPEEHDAWRRCRVVRRSRCEIAVRFVA